MKATKKAKMVKKPKGFQTNEQALKMLMMRIEENELRQPRLTAEQLNMIDRTREQVANAKRIWKNLNDAYNSDRSETTKILEVRAWTRWRELDTDLKLMLRGDFRKAETTRQFAPVSW